MLMPDAHLEQLSKYQDALFNAEMGLWELDIPKKQMTWDEGFRRLHSINEGRYGCLVEEWFERIYEEDRPRIRCHVQKVISDEADLDFKYRVISGLNLVKHIHCRAYKIKKDDTIVKLVGLHRDVTTESLLEIELTKAKEFTEKILNAIPDPIFVKNEKREVIYANSEYEKFLNTTKDRFLNKIICEFLPIELVTNCNQTDRAAFNNNVAQEIEETYVDVQGRVRSIHTKKTPYSLSPTEKILVGVIRDITDLKSIQNSLVKQSKMASLGEMASEIAHEINNPLMIIQGKSQMLQNKIFNTQIDLANCQKDLEQIEINCGRIDKIIKSLKSVSRKADHDPFENVSILKLVDEAFEISKERFKRRKFNLFVLADESIDYTYLTRARPSEIVQVLVNLLNNSYDAIQGQERGWTRINLSLSANDFCIEVVDSGDEIEPEIAIKMMEPFFTTKSTGRGTGLGLSVSKQIIQNHNGDLYYEPKDNRTRFVFTLPRV